MLGGVLPLRCGDGGRLLLEKERGVKDRLRRGSLALKGTVVYWTRVYPRMWARAIVGVDHLALGVPCCVRVHELCESRGGRPGLSVLMSLAVSVDVKQH